MNKPFVFTQSSDSIIQLYSMHRLYSSFFFPCSVFVLYSHTNLHSSSWISYSRDLSARWPYWIVTVTAQDRLLEMLHFYLATNMKGLLSHIASHRIWNAHVILQIQFRVDVDRSADWMRSVVWIRWAYENHMSIVCISHPTTELCNKFTLILVIGAVFPHFSVLPFGF